MKAIGVLAIVALVLGSLGTMLASFPSANMPATDEVSSDVFSPELVEQTADRFNSVYGLIVTDLVSYAENPDLDRAEAKRTEMVTYATTVSDSMEQLATTLQGQLDRLTRSADGEEAAAAQ